MFLRGPWVQEDETFGVYYLVFRHRERALVT